MVNRFLIYDEPLSVLRHDTSMFHSIYGGNSEHGLCLDCGPEKLVVSCKSVQIVCYQRKSNQA